MELQPFQQPYPPLWYPTHNPESVQYAAQTRVQLRRPWARPCRAASTSMPIGEPGTSPARLRPAERPCRQHPSSASCARSSWPKPMTRRSRPRTRRMGTGIAPSPSCGTTTMTTAWTDCSQWDTAMQNETMIIGSPVRVREQMGRLIEESGCNYVICSFAWGTLPHQQALRSLQLFAQRGDAGVFCRHCVTKYGGGFLGTPGWGDGSGRARCSVRSGRWGLVPAANRRTTGGRTCCRSCPMPRGVAAADNAGFSGQRFLIG